MADYCTRRGNGLDPQYFADYYAARGWYLNGRPMRSWRAALRSWERNGFARPDISPGAPPGERRGTASAQSPENPREDPAEAEKLENLRRLYAHLCKTDGEDEKGGTKT